MSATHTAIIRTTGPGLNYLDVELSFVDSCNRCGNQHRGSHSESARITQLFFIFFLFPGDQGGTGIFHFSSPRRTNTTKGQLRAFAITKNYNRLKVSEYADWQHRPTLKCWAPVYFASLFTAARRWPGAHTINTLMLKPNLKANISFFFFNFRLELLSSRNDIRPEG